MAWTTDEVVRLRTLWAEGHSTAEIGRRIGYSKSAVTSKAKRIDLPARPSPIIRDKPKALSTKRIATPHNSRYEVVAPACTLQPVVSLSVVFGRSDQLQGEAPLVGRQPQPLRSRPASNCKWPIGQPGTRDFHFCGESPVEVKSYCKVHAALAFPRLSEGALK
ncbi:GcrA family cell cycle regulator [Patescibacteria group bacterium]|nr:GcrA family cell cycle regulator [Patescibacteria group bacterium]